MKVQAPLQTAFAALFISCVIAAVYWPVTHAGFVWIDKIGFSDAAWTVFANDWKQLFTHDFYGWVNYFRPFVIALFALEIRIFGISAASMHLVSLGLHILNATLVGILALKYSTQYKSRVYTRMLAGLSMLLYALHPALIEPVVWIACQFELTLTFFMLLALWFETTIRSLNLRAAAIAICFFLAACSKEAAASFPLIVALFIFMRNENTDPQTSWREVWRSQRLLFASLIAAGTAYLVLRNAALGVLLNPTRHEAIVSVLRFQEICDTYVTYWRIILWPMYKLGPLHEVDVSQFGIINFSSLSVDALAILIFFAGFFLAAKRQYLGYIVIAVTVALVPVLHLIPVAFDESLYHERYTMFAIALTMILLPSAAVQSVSKSTSRFSLHAFTCFALLWCIIAILNIRVTLPLWSDERSLWQWMQVEYPDSLIVKDHLLSTYIENGNNLQARTIADDLVKQDAPCPNCLLNAANLALAQHDVARASAALERLKNSTKIAPQPHVIQGYVVANGELLELTGRRSEAEEAYRGAIAMNPLDPQAQMALALLLARENRESEARNQVRIALVLFPQDQRAFQENVYRDALSSTHSMPATNP